MKKQNVTVAMPRDLLKRVKIMAAENDTSISALLVHLLQEQLSRHEGYVQAHTRQAALMEHGLNLGTGGEQTWTREELHER